MTTIHSVDEFKEGVKRSAEQLVLKSFPQKIIKVDQLLKDQKFDLLSIETRIRSNSAVPSFLETLDGQSPNKKFKECEQNDCSAEEVKTESNVILGINKQNTYLEELVSIVRPLMLEFIDDMLALKIGINLMIPKIEDGNNFGVEVQQEILESITSVEEDMHTRLTAIANYYIARADMVSRLTKHPSIDDYRIAIEERSQSFNVFLNVTLVLVRNYYTNLHDLVLKNLNKIKEPKSGGNEEMLY